MLVTIGSRKEYRLKSEMPADTDRQQDGNGSETDRIQIVSKMETDRIQNGNTGKDRLGKDSTGKGRKEETRISNDILVEKKGPEEGPEASSSPKENEQPVFIEIPVIGGKSAAIPESFATQMQELYPAIDVREEIRRAKAWLLANPRNAKKDWKRFINMWLSRAQDRAKKITVCRSSRRLFQKAASTITAAAASRQGGWARNPSPGRKIPAAYSPPSAAPSRNRGRDRGSPASRAEASSSR